jgi:hypothetical protein
MTAASDLYYNIDQRRRERFQRGLRKYRQSPDEPFVGDPRAELMEEIEDALNYVEECARQTTITAWAASEIEQRLRECVHALAVDVERMRRLRQETFLVAE